MAASMIKMSALVVGLISGLASSGWADSNKAPHSSPPPAEETSKRVPLPAPQKTKKAEQKSAPPSKSSPRKSPKTKNLKKTVSRKTAPTQSQRDREIIAHLELLMMLELLSDYELFDEPPP